MKMRERKVALQARQMLGLRIAQLLAELDEAADLLIEALESGDLPQDNDGDAGDGQAPSTRQGEI
ncbi:hypothetical protein [Noviherbaspirillum aridicola]|uniref:Uncharacterized protein n=1 Tax=Noviherbaspirillum aridicola TaxID=2849687 RepID=A0ABQ4Q3V5_9BURK|nr:hypothetical protein [Noviherbaspirillum aridicola]GIZ51701.1 hypothetical protein NCCP691_17150 [Noviherbaspirillum aridicola]